MNNRVNSQKSSNVSPYRRLSFPEETNVINNSSEGTSLNQCPMPSRTVVSSNNEKVLKLPIPDFSCMEDRALPLEKRKMEESPEISPNKKPKLNNKEKEEFWETVPLSVEKSSSSPTGSGSPKKYVGISNSSKKSSPVKIANKRSISFLATGAHTSVAKRSLDQALNSVSNSVTKRQRRGVEEEEGPFKNLIVDEAWLILDFLLKVGDMESILAFASVCKNWRSIAWGFFARLPKDTIDEISVRYINKPLFLKHSVRCIRKFHLVLMITKNEHAEYVGKALRQYTVKTFDFGRYNTYPNSRLRQYVHYPESSYGWYSRSHPSFFEDKLSLLFYIFDNLFLEKPKVHHYAPSFLKLVLERINEKVNSAEGGSFGLQSLRTLIEHIENSFNRLNNNHFPDIVRLLRVIIAGGILDKSLDKHEEVINSLKLIVSKDLLAKRLTKTTVKQMVKFYIALFEGGYVKDKREANELIGEMLSTMQSRNDKINIDKSTTCQMVIRGIQECLNALSLEGFVLDDQNWDKLAKQLDKFLEVFYNLKEQNDPENMVLIQPIFNNFYSLLVFILNKGFYPSTQKNKLNTFLRELAMTVGGLDTY